MREQQARGWVAIPHQLLDEAACPGGATRIYVYALVCRYGGMDRGTTITVTGLADRCGCGLRTVKRALGELLEAGWLERELIPGLSSSSRAKPWPERPASRTEAAGPRPTLAEVLATADPLLEGF